MQRKRSQSRLGFLSAGLVSAIAFSALAIASRATAAPAPDVWNGRVYDVQSRQFITEAQAREALASVRVLVLAEKHDTESVQVQEARALDWALESQKFGPLEKWTLGWEFLNRRDQASIDASWTQFKEGALSADQLMDQLQGAGRERTYIPILASGARFGGQLAGVNLSREEKAPVVKDGLSSLDPALIPPGFEMGGPGYRERFEVAMGDGHATPEQIDRYFEAQCLTDDVLAYQLLQSRVRFRALVVGSFHADYFDGVAARIRARAPDQPVHVIRFVDASDYVSADLDPDLILADPVHHKRYGPIANWVWFAGEPRAQAANQ